MTDEPKVDPLCWYCGHCSGEHKDACVSPACGCVGYVPDRDTPGLVENGWLCICGHWQEDGCHCDSCKYEPPQGCPCSFCQEPEVDEETAEFNDDV